LHLRGLQLWADLQCRPLSGEVGGLRPTLRRNSGTLRWADTEGHKQIVAEGVAASRRRRTPRRRREDPDGYRQLGGDPPAGLSRVVHIGTSVDGMGDITLFFQAPQHGTNRRLLERPGQPFANRFRGHRRIGPNQLRDLSLKIAKILQAIVVFLAHVSAYDLRRRSWRDHDSATIHSIGGRTVQSTAETLRSSDRIFATFIFDIG